MSEKYGLSNKAITEEYEDLIFRKVMARYAENQSEKIEEEIAAENAAADKNILRKLFGKKERRENAATLWKYGKKLITAAAMVVFVGVVSVSSVVVASAEAREAIAEYLYSLIIKDEGNKIVVSSGQHEDIRTHRYVLSYIPDGYHLSESSPNGGDGRIDFYSSGEEEFAFIENINEIWTVPEAYEGEEIEIETIEDRTVYIISYADNRISLKWLEEDAILSIDGSQDNRGVLFDIMEGVVFNEKYEGERTPIEIAEEVPEELQEELSEKERLGLEHYNWDGAWMPTYIPEGYACDISGGSSSGVYHVNYIDGDNYIIIEQRNKDYILSAEEEFESPISGYFASGYEVYYTVWIVDNTLISIISNRAEVLEIAKGMVPSEHIPEKRYLGKCYALQYIPEGFILTEEYDSKTSRYETYTNGDLFFSFKQRGTSVVANIPTEYDEQKTIMIGESEALYTRFTDATELFWYTEDGFFRFSYNIPDEEIFKIIDSLAPVEQE